MDRKPEPGQVCLIDHLLMGSPAVARFELEPYPSFVRLADSYRIGLAGTQRWVDAETALQGLAGAGAESGLDLRSLDDRMAAAGMTPLSELLSNDQPINKFRVHTSVTNLASFTQWLRMKAGEYARTFIRMELDKRQDDELYEWMLAHYATFTTVLLNFKAAIMGEQAAVQFEDDDMKTKITALLALEGRSFATLTPAERKTLSFFTTQGRKFGVGVKIGAPSPDLLPDFTDDPRQYAEALSQTNAVVSVFIDPNQYCILPSGNSADFPVLDAELQRLGVAATYCEAGAPERRKRIYCIPAWELIKLPDDEQGHYLGTADCGHTIYPMPDIDEYRASIQAGPWVDLL